MNDMSVRAAPPARSPASSDAPCPAPVGTAFLIVGAPDSCRAVARALQGDDAFADSEILFRSQPGEALAVLESRKDIGVVLLLGAGGESGESGEAAGIAPDDLVALVSTINGIHADSFRSVMVRSPHRLPDSVRADLWQLGVADRLFAQAIDGAEFVDSAATVMRDALYSQGLVAVSGASRKLEHARTLRELAGLVLATVHGQGIGLAGGVFWLLGSSSALLPARLMSVAGSGRYAGIGCIALERFEDRRASELIELSRQRQQSQFTPEAAVIHVRTPDDDVACIYVALERPLLSWQRRLVRVLTKAFSFAISKAQAEQRLLRTQRATITTMAALAEYRDMDTGEHVARVARSATEIAQVLADLGRFPETDHEIVAQIGLASILHDIGKIAIPEDILLKAGPLDAAERKAMQEHAQLGSEILLRAAQRSDNAELLHTAAEIARHHHERYDGKGYPDGLRGEEIPLSARIVALVDVFDALTSTRPYKAAWPREKAIATIRAEAGHHFDPHVVEAFLFLEERKKAAGFFVWSEEMSVGHPLLDMDHRRLIDIINRLWVADGAGNRQVIEFVLDDLIHYTESHFEREEEILARDAYPDLERHCEIHQDIRLRLEEIRWEYFQGIRHELRGEILEFLKNWLNKHILVEDMRYTPYLESAD